MKRILFLAGIVILGTAWVLGGFYVHQLWLDSHPGAGFISSTPPPAPPPPPPTLQPLPDIDALAARMKKNQDIYQKVRDEALAAYAAKNPASQPYDEEAKATLRLAAYLSVWDDYYGEGLWPQLGVHTDHLPQEGCTDPIWEILSNLKQDRDSHSNSEQDALEVNQQMLAIDGTPYPALFKYEAYESAILNLVAAKTSDIHLQKSLDAIPDLTARATTQYQELIKAGYPNDILFQKGRNFLKDVQDDEPTLQAVSESLGHAFDATAKDSVVAPVLEADFYVEDAWAARGSGYSNTVTDEGWRLFRERLAHANDILTDLYTKYPNEGMIPDVMMTVVLGQQQPRDQMELWFSRGIQADPDNFHLYMAKRWYLYPRWYGSDDDLWKFGTECAQSNNWSAKIPMIFIESIADTADRNPDFFASPDVWTPVEKVYRDYLNYYPASVHYRSLFAKSAVQGKHWDVAKEQFKILGDDWDRDVFEGDDYTTMTRLTNANAK